MTSKKTGIFSKNLKLRTKYCWDYFKWFMTIHSWLIMRIMTNKCICKYVHLLYYKYRNLLHISATYCDHLQTGVLIYCAVLKRLATPSDFHIPLPPIVPFAHSETSFTHGCIYPILPGFSGTTLFFLPSGFQVTIILAIALGPFSHHVHNKLVVFGLCHRQVSPPWRRYFVLGNCGLAYLEDPGCYAGGSLATGMVSLAGQDEGERSDEERYSGTPGWGLRRWTSIPTLAKNVL
jgi:hypothetical protein